VRIEKTNPLEQAEDQAKQKKQNRTHWSRKPEQISQDSKIFQKADLIFQEEPSGFNRIQSVELKNRVIDLLMEAKFEEADDPEHKLAQKIWHENIEELRET
jgi:hypothetical protein